MHLLLSLPFSCTFVFNLIFTFHVSVNVSLTFTFRTLREVIFNGDRSPEKNVAIVITDGKSNVNTDETITEANRLKATGTRVLAIGITSSINITELKAIASNDSDVIIVDTYANLFNVVDDIVGKACIPDYGPSGKP